MAGWGNGNPAGLLSLEKAGSTPAPATKIPCSENDRTVRMDVLYSVIAKEYAGYKKWLKGYFFYINSETVRAQQEPRKRVKITKRKGCYACKNHGGELGLIGKKTF